MRFVKLAEWRMDCKGIVMLACVRGHIWGGAYDGSVYIWDAAARAPVQEMHCHNDAVRSICAVGPRTVVSGGGSRDGMLVVWHTVARGRRAPAVGSSITAQLTEANNKKKKKKV